MKKTILILGVIFMTNFAQSQVLSKTASTNTLIIYDTLHYYFNKQYFKTGDTGVANYPNFRTNATALASSTAITYCCSKFEVPPGETVLVTGLEALPKRKIL